MNQSKLLFSVLFAFALMAGGTIGAYGQPEGGPRVEPSYEVSLQLLIGSNDAAGRPDVPANLSNVSRQLRSTFAFSNYRLASTFLGRISNNGNFDYKSVTNILGQESDVRGSFLEWSMNGLRSLPTAAGKQGFQAQAFRFGAKVPVTMGSVTDQNGKVSSAISYESIGVHLNKVGLPENVPTLIGTLNLPGAGGTIFLVMTVRSADM